MKRALLVLVALTLTLVFVLTGCTEDFRQDAIAGTYDDYSVSSNGGLAVRVDDYVFYINGNAEETSDNIFGQAIKGAIMRANIDKDGKIVADSAVVIVPKNVYGTVATSGLYVVDGYLYYTSPSTQKDSEGKYKTQNMTLLRTKLDGTDTEEIITFDDYKATFKIGKTAIMYHLASSYELHSISLTDGDFTDTKISDKVSSLVFTENDVYNDFNEWAFYTKSSEEATATHSLIYKIKLDGSESSLLIDGRDGYPAEIRNLQINGNGAVANTTSEKGFTITLSSAYLKSDGIRLIYTKSDGGTNALSTGIYMTELDSSMTFDATKESKLSTNGKIADLDDTYTSYVFLDNNNALATGKSSIQWIKRDGNVWKAQYRPTTNTQCIGVASSVIEYKVENGKGVLYYFNSTKVQKYELFELNEDGSIKGYLDTNSQDFISAITAKSEWLAGEKIGSNYIYFNSDVSNYTYAINFDEIKLADGTNAYDANTVKNVLLSKVSEEDKATLAATK